MAPAELLGLVNFTVVIIVIVWMTRRASVPTNGTAAVLMAHITDLTQRLSDVENEREVEIAKIQERYLSAVLKIEQLTDELYTLKIRIAIYEERMKHAGIDTTSITATINLQRALRLTMERHLSHADIRSMAFDLDLDADRYRRDSFTADFLDEVRRKGKTGELVLNLREEWPMIAWPEAGTYD